MERDLSVMAPICQSVVNTTAALEIVRNNNVRRYALNYAGREFLASVHEIDVSSDYTKGVPHTPQKTNFLSVICCIMPLMLTGMGITIGEIIRHMPDLHAFCCKTIGRLMGILAVESKKEGDLPLLRKKKFRNRSQFLDGM
jgi:hypothetical protein